MKTKNNKIEKTPTQEINEINTNAPTVERLYSMERWNIECHLNESINTLEDLLKCQLKQNNKKFHKLIKKALKQTKKLIKIKEQMWTILNWNDIYESNCEDKKPLK